MNNAENNKRIAKNTLLLYVRMLFMMVVSLFTSRITLAALGITDFGIYNVVGGMVAMFSILSGSLSVAISRFITVEVGKEHKDKLNAIFSMSVSIQIFMALAVSIIAEIAGVWFLDNKIVIPADRLYAAHWVLHLSILTFVVNLISVPYNAIIVAYEKMSAFAYISMSFLAIWQSFRPVYELQFVIIGCMSFVGNGLFLVSMTKIARLIASDNEQGRYFGFLESGRGIAGTLLTLIAVGIVSAYESEALSIGFILRFDACVYFVLGIVSYIYSFLTIIYGFYLYFAEGNADLIIVTPIIIVFLFGFSWLVKKFFGVKR